MPVTSLWRVKGDVAAVVRYAGDAQKTRYAQDQKTVSETMERQGGTEGEFSVYDLHAVADYATRDSATTWKDGSGIVRQGHRTFRDAYCDVDDGIVTCIRMYGCGDAWDRRDHDGETCEITESIVGYLDGDLDYSWDALIESIADTVEKYTAEE